MSQKAKNMISQRKHTGADPAQIHKMARMEVQRGERRNLRDSSLDVSERSSKSVWRKMVNRCESSFVK